MHLLKVSYSIINITVIIFLTIVYYIINMGGCSFMLCDRKQAVWGKSFINLCTEIFISHLHKDSKVA